MDIQTIKAARERIAPYTVQTPLIRMANLDAFLGCQVYVKAECMQITGAFKLRGAMNRALSLSGEELARGLVCASSGNHGKGIAYAAKALGTKATIVMPYTSPKVKVEAIKALGAEVVQCETSERFDVAERVCAEKGATMVPPYNDEAVMTGQGTAGLEIMEQLPDVNAVVVPVSGGGLIGGVSTAIKSVNREVKVYGAEPAALPRYSRSLEAGVPQKVEQKPTIADALVSQMPGDKCFPYVKENVDAVYTVAEEYILKAMKMLLCEGKLLAEPSSCIGMAAVLEGKLKFDAEDKVCFLVSGGSVGLEQLSVLQNVTY